MMPTQAPAHAAVEFVVDGIVDNVPGKRNRSVAGGNSVQIRHDGFVTDFDHFQFGSIVVKRGDKEKAGDLIGRCGNSGNSPERHLHFQIQSVPGCEQGVALRPVFDSGLISRVRTAWSKPIDTLTNHELATCLRQKIAVGHSLLIAEKRVHDGVVDDSELHDTELAEAIADAKYSLRADDEDRRIRGLSPRTNA